jgi:acyl-CoA synthetase (AMP-forming)/AMP-acid ligase II
MLGLMQRQPLLISSLLEHAALNHGDAEIVTGLVEGGEHRSDWAAVADRARRLGALSRRLGLQIGDRVASLAWNTHRHLEIYFGVTGAGCVLNTVNPRLFPEHIEYIINKAEDQFVFFDLTFLSLLEDLAPRLHSVRGYIAMTDKGNMPASSSLDLLCYETLLEAEDDYYEWPVLGEDAGSTLCFTSGTTGNPKGVLYSHRSTVLQAMAAVAPDAMNLSSRDRMLLVAPLFHVNAWGAPFAAALCGACLVMPGPQLDGASLFSLLLKERCTFSLGVPTVWLGLLDHAELYARPDEIADIRLKRVLVGGSAAPRALIERFDRLFGTFVLHAWGMTETSPLATVGALKAKHADLAPEKRFDLQMKQGRSLFGVEMKIVDDDGARLPRGGDQSGALMVRGPWIVSTYFGEPAGPLDSEGWFATGDVARIDTDGYLQITDRAKDVIKSGGEWISSIDLENAAMSYPGVIEAAVIGVPHARWQERPLMLVRARSGIDRTGLMDHLGQHVARWWLPDDILFVDELPHTATGKLLKTVLREAYRNHLNVEIAQA